MARQQARNAGNAMNPPAKTRIRFLRPVVAAVWMLSSTMLAGIENQEPPVLAAGYLSNVNFGGVYMREELPTRGVEGSCNAVLQVLIPIRGVQTREAVRVQESMRVERCIHLMGAANAKQIIVVAGEWQNSGRDRVLSTATRVWAPVFLEPANVWLQKEGCPWCKTEMDRLAVGLLTAGTCCLSGESNEILVARKILRVSEVLGPNETFRVVNKMVISDKRFEKDRMTVAISRLAGFCQVEGRRLIAGKSALAELARTPYPYPDVLDAEAQKVFDRERTRRLRRYREILLTRAGLLERELRDLEVLSAMDNSVVRKEAQELLAKASGGLRGSEALYCSSVH
jgi:hypothetical protein